jgi:glycosyltransferase involved in cell wall biosynthesis
MASSALPLVTIGIPTYNRADSYLRYALESALAQTYNNIEIIVSDNCSTDGTEALVRSYSDPRIRYLKQERGLQPNDNFNFCLSQAAGSYFLLLHDDDLIDSDFIDTCIRSADYETTVGIIRTGTRIIDSRGIFLYQCPNHAAGLATAEFFLAWFSGQAGGLYLCSTLFNTQGLREIGGFRSKHNLFQDVLAEVQLAARLGRVDVAEVKASFRKHSGEYTFSARVNHWCEDSLELLETMCNLVDEKKELVRSKGMRFFARINYSRADSVRSLPERLAAYLLVFRKFGYQYLPTFRLLIRHIPMYRAVRHVLRKRVANQY